MKRLLVQGLMVVSLAGTASAQTTPWVVPFNGVATDALGVPLTGPVAMTFSVYEQSTGGVPLWVEVQMVEADAAGAYVALLGASTDGLPASLFASGSARWLAAQPEGQPEPARVLLASVPYALKAADAETVGGLPASAFLLANAVAGASAASGSPPLGLAVPATDGDGPAGAGSDEPGGAGLITGNESIRNSLCVGGDCAASETYGFDTIKLKENNTRILFDDTSTSSGFPSNDWQLTANDSGSGTKSKFSIDDVTSGRTPFTVEAFGPSHALYVDSSGKVGMGTNSPSVKLHLKNGNTPTTRLEQDGSSGFTAQTWDVAGNEANFFIRDTTSGSELPFRIQPGSASNTLSIRTDGVVIGKWQATTGATTFDVFGTAMVGPGTESNPAITIREGSSGTSEDSGFWAPNQNEIAISTNGSERMRVDDTGQVGIGTNNVPGAIMLDVAGSARVDNGDAGHPGLIFNEGGASEDTGLFSPTTNEVAVSTNGSERLRITSGGNVLVGGTSSNGRTLQVYGDAYCSACNSGGTWFTTSDRRLKTGIEDLGGALDLMKRLHPVKFFYSAEYRGRVPSVPASAQYGFLAQEFQQVFPDSVKEGPDGFLVMNAGHVLPYMAKGFQEVLDIIETQEAQIADQRRQIAAQREQSDAQQAEIDAQRDQIAELRALVESIVGVAPRR